MRYRLLLLSLLLGVLVATSAVQPPPAMTAGTSLNTIQRDFEPVVVKGQNLPGLEGRATGEFVVYAYDAGSGAWRLIPSQVDERKDVTVQGQCSHVENMYASEDGLMDDDDELAFMASDLGDSAPAGAVPPGDGTTAYRVQVTDPRPGGGQGWAYVTASASPPPSPADYVSYSTTRTLPDDQSIVAEDTRVQTDAYEVHFSGRWTMDELALGSSPDILDKYRGTWWQSPDNPGETESTWDGTSWTLYYKDGPVRALRVIRGAASGPSTTYNVEFYRQYMRIRTILRVHAGTDLYRFFDYNSNAIGMTYYRSTNPNGFTIDGVADDPGSDLGNWEEVSGAPGTLVYYLELETNAATPVPYYRDATGVPEKSGGDGNSYGNHGVHFPSLLDTDCQANAHYLRGSIDVYVLPPNLGRVGDTYAELEENPIQIAVANAQGPAVGGIAEAPSGSEAPAGEQHQRMPDSAVLSGAAIGGVVLLAAAGWYATRRRREG